MMCSYFLFDVLLENSDYFSTIEVAREKLEVRLLSTGELRENELVRFFYRFRTGCSGKR